VSGYLQIAEQPGVLSGQQDAALYGSQDRRRYTKRIRNPMRAEGRVRGLLHRGSCVIAPNINASWYDSGSLDGAVGANNEIDRE